MSQGDSPRLAKGQHWRLSGSLYRLANSRLLLVELLRSADGAWVYAPRFAWSSEQIARAELVSEPPYELVSELTAWDAVEDGLLIDATRGVLAGVTRQHFKWPVLHTFGVQSVIQTAVENPDWCNDWRGVWADILTIAKSPLAHQIDECTREFTVAIYGLGDRKFKAQSGPSGYTDPRPVVIISLPNED